MHFFLFYQILDRFHNWLRNQTFEQDIELGNIANHRSLTNNPDWSHEATLNNKLWLLEILDGFMALLADRQGLSPEDLEKGLPLVNYKSLGKTLDECVICLKDFEDDEQCLSFSRMQTCFSFQLYR